MVLQHSSVGKKLSHHPYLIRSTLKRKKDENLTGCTVDALESNKNWYKMCEILVHVSSAIGELQHSKYLKLTFLDA